MQGVRCVQHLHGRRTGRLKGHRGDGPNHDIAA
jgi:hypothetical protein